MASLRRHKSLLYARLGALPLGLIAACAHMTGAIGGRPMYYILDGHTPRAVPFWRHVWQAQARGELPTTVARSRVGRYRVSTIFLGLDANPFSKLPLLFETMAFALRPDGARAAQDVQYRYPTWAEAMRGHRKLVGHLASIKPGNAHG